MKKFLSLVMALVMTMSLVTIGAGATEYEDLTDKSEIQYEEAVAVLNKLGIISGYEDGSFRPTGALTRGAAAKIIVSLMIGTEAANALTVSAAPYSDVPVTNTFAAVISYCKTAGYINGYTDGTFRPAAALTGYAFTKMLLGALGYDGKQEGFTGEGWIMNVSKLGNTAGLFNDFKTAFKGNDGVNREQACQLALNTLKATLVEYSGGSSVTTSAGDATTSVVTNKVRSYVTSNNGNINQNINKTNAGNQANYFTLEFGEEHFQDLILVSDGGAYDDFGRPSNEWSYKKVKVGTFAHTPDFVFTEQKTKVVDGDSLTTRAKALGMKDYKVASGLTAVVNGRDASTTIADVGQIADYTDNGATVEVYLNDKSAAQTVTDVVVVKTQLMQVNKVTSSYVSLKRMNDDVGTMVTYNKLPIQTNVTNVQDDDEPYTTLKDLKTDDYVVVTPLYNGSTYDVSSVVVPTTVSGKLTSVKTYSKYASWNGNTPTENQIGVTVAGTDYSMSQWNQKFDSLTANTITATKKDVTVYLDAFGYAMLIKDAGAATEYMVVKGEYQTLIDNKLVTMLQGYDVSDGTELSLNIGTSAKMGTLTKVNGTPLKPGDLVQYSTANTANGADYVISAPIYERGTVNKGIRTLATAGRVSTPPAAPVPGTDYYNGSRGIKSSDTKLKVDEDAVVPGAPYGQNWNITNPSAEDYYFASDVKFIFVTFDGNTGYGTDDVKSVTVKTGAQNVDFSDLTGAQAYVKSANGDTENQVKAVVIMQEANDATSATSLYIRNTLGSQGVTEDGKRIYGYTVDMNTKDGVEEEKTIYSFKSLNVGDFATYSQRTDVAGYTDNFYNLSQNTSLKKTTSVAFDANLNCGSDIRGANNTLLTVTGAKDYSTGSAITTANSNMVNAAGVNGQMIDLNTRGAVWVDTTGNSISSGKDLKDYTSAVLSFVFNDNNSSDGYGTANFIIVKSVTGTGTLSVGATAGLEFNTSNSFPGTSTLSSLLKGQRIYVKSSVAGLGLSGFTTYPASMTHEGSNVYSFLMPETNIPANAFVFTTTAVPQLLPAEVASVVLSGVSTVVTSKPGQTVTEAIGKEAIRIEMENDGYTVKEIDSSNPAAITFTGEKMVGTVKDVVTYTWDPTGAGIVNVVTYDLTAGALGTVYSNPGCTTAVTPGTDALNNVTTYYVKAAATREALSGISGAALSLENEPAIKDGTANEAIYSFIPNGDVNMGTGSSTQAWFATGSASLPNVDTSITLSVAADSPYAAAGDTVTYTITVGGAATSVSQTITFSMTGATMGNINAHSGTNVAAAGGTKTLTTTAASATTGTFTFTATSFTADAVISAS